jgi:superfamily II DNA or RNA helicase
MQRVIPVRIDTHLRVDANLLGDSIVTEICDDLILVNPERLEAEAKQQWGWQQIPDQFFMVELDGDELIMARGYALQLKLLLRERGLKVWWQDRTTWHRGEPAFGPGGFHFLPHQVPAVQAMINHRQGIYKSPTGSGKTVAALGMIWKLRPARSLILVDRIHLVDQWINRTVEHFGRAGCAIDTHIGRIGEGRWSEGRITIATVQTLHSQADELEELGWFASWDVMILDESHHATAVTFQDLIQRFPARYRLGMSATPDKTGLFELAQNALGEVFYETTQAELRKLGLLVEPEIQVVPTNFTFPYWGDHRADKRGDCQKLGCKSLKPFHRHRNNYGDLKATLVSDDERNELIVKTVVENRDRIQLIITDQTTQIAALHERLDQRQAELGCPIYILTGRQSGKQRAEIIKQIETDMLPCVILSTIAGEALDIPIIDVIHLVFPTRNPRKTEQNIGRGTRSHQDKAGVLILDYVDHNVSVLAGQFRSRRWECYEPMGYKVNSPNEVTTTPKRKRGLTNLGG